MSSTATERVRGTFFGFWRTYGEHKAKMISFAIMPVRSCRVTIRDLEGIDHTVSVTASTLYEAVALGIASLRGEEWVACISDGPSTVKVAVTDIPIKHHVTMKDFRSWLDRPPRSPRDIAQRARVREILETRSRLA